MQRPEQLQIELIDRGHPALPEFFHGLPVESGWPEGTVLSLTDREPTEFERAAQFIAAFVREGEGQPRLFIVSERTPPAERVQGSHRLRVINSSMDEVMDVDARWARLDDFSGQALEMGAQLLGLDQETPYPLG